MRNTSQAKLIHFQDFDESFFHRFMIRSELVSQSWVRELTIDCGNNSVLAFGDQGYAIGSSYVDNNGISHVKVIEILSGNITAFSARASGIGSLMERSQHREANGPVVSGLGIAMVP
jgi:hypothetical protein